MTQAWLFDENDREQFRKLIRAEMLRLGNTSGRPFAPQELGTAPEIYIARTPAAGIPAIVGEFSYTGTGTGSCIPGWAGTGTGTGTGTWATDDDQPGYADCQVYRIIERCGVPVVDHVSGLVKRVYNLSTSAIPGDTWIRIARDKWGSWLAEPQSGGTQTIGPSISAGGRLSTHHSDPTRPRDDGDGEGAYAYRVWYVPFIHDKIPIWDGSAYVTRAITCGSGEPSGYRTSADVDALKTSGSDFFNFDVFIYWDGSQTQLELRRWDVGQEEAYAGTHSFYDTSVTPYQIYYGPKVKTGDPTRRYLGTGRYYAADGFIHNLSPKACLLWNAENRIPSTIYVPGVNSPGTSDYNSTTNRWWGGTATTDFAYRFRWVNGFDEGFKLHLVATESVKSTSTVTSIYFGIGVSDSDSDTGPDNLNRGICQSPVTVNGYMQVTISRDARINLDPDTYNFAGYHSAAPTEATDGAAATVTWNNAFGTLTGIGWF
jgi:hypothetical protein